MAEHQRRIVELHCCRCCCHQAETINAIVRRDAASVSEVPSSYQLGRNKDGTPCKVCARAGRLCKRCMTKNGCPSTKEPSHAPNCNSRGAQMKIFIKTMSGKTLILDAFAALTVSDVKHAVQTNPWKSMDFWVFFWIFGGIFWIFGQIFGFLVKMRSESCRRLRDLQKSIVILSNGAVWTRNVTLLMKTLPP